MNSYTNDDIKDLLSSLSHLGSSDNIIINNSGRFVDSHYFKSFVLLDPAYNSMEVYPEYKQLGSEIINILTDIRKLIYEEPLYRVPLYINLYIDVVSWRLRIAK